MSECNMDNQMGYNLKRIYTTLRAAGYISLAALTGCVTLTKRADLNGDGVDDILFRSKNGEVTWVQGQEVPSELEAKAKEIMKPKEPVRIPPHVR